MWPGTDFKYDNKSCHFIEVYNKTIPFNDRVDKVIEWFTDPITPANLVLLYIEDPDFHAHAFGPESDVINQVLYRLDKLTEYIQIKLKENNLDKRVNVIHLSDHGMESVTENNFIDLSKILKNGTYTIYGTSPVIQIIPKIGMEISIYNLLKNASKLYDNFKVFYNNELFTKWHYRNDRRTGPITIVANVGYGFNDMKKSKKFYEHLFNVTCK